MRRLETAEQFTTRRQAQAMVDALREIRKLNPPCAVCKDARWEVVTAVNGEYRAVCRQCSTNARVDRRVARNRADRAAMGRR